MVIRVAWLQFAGRIKIAGGVLAALALVIGYVIAKREPPEG